MALVVGESGYQRVRAARERGSEGLTHRGLLSGFSRNERPAVRRHWRRRGCREKS
jgi:hypothetical protein